MLSNLLLHVQAIPHIGLQFFNGGMKSSALFCGLESEIRDG
jgi:hypothetical protein